MNQKGMMALDVVVKFVIVLVVAAVVIGLFVTFSHDAESGVRDMFGEEEGPEIDFPKTVQQNTFSAGSVAQYVESCYDTMMELSEIEQEDTVCYILMANIDFSEFTSVSEIEGAVSSDLGQNVEFNTDLGRAYIQITFKELGNTVVVS